MRIFSTLLSQFLPCSPRRYLYTPVETHVVNGNVLMSIGDCDSSFDTQTFWVAPQVNSNMNTFYDDKKSADRSSQGSSLFGRMHRGVILYMDGNKLAGALAWIPQADNVYSRNYKYNDYTNEYDVDECVLTSTVENFRTVILQARRDMDALAFDVRI